MRSLGQPRQASRAAIPFFRYAQQPFVGQVGDNRRPSGQGAACLPYEAATGKPWK